MKDWKWWLLGASVLVLSLLVGPFSSFTAGQKVEASRFEYKVLRLNNQEYVKTQEYKKILQKSKSKYEAQSKFVEFVCNYYGDRGWELIKVDHPNRGPVMILYFKRSKP